MRLATCAFYANANVRPTAPKDVVPYDLEQKVEHVTPEQFREDYYRIYRRSRGGDN